VLAALPPARQQVSRLEQRILFLTADNEELQSKYDSACRNEERARDSAAAASAGEGLDRLPRDKWPLPVLMLVQQAEAAAVNDIEEKHVSGLGGCPGGIAMVALSHSVGHSCYTVPEL
jgi:hypothetical protein